MSHAAGGAESGVSRDPNVLISFVASAATAGLVLTAPDALDAVELEPWTFLAFLGLTFGLQIVAVEVYGRGAISFAGTGLLAVGFVFGPGAAMVVASTIGIVNLVQRRGRWNRGVFDAAQMALAVGAGTGLYHALTGPGSTLAERLGPALGASVVYMIVNLGLLSFAMSLAEETSAVEIWKERFRWFTPYYLVSGPLALALTAAYEETGIIGMLAFALPPAFMMLSIRQYLARTREAVEEIRQKNEELAERNEDLRALFELTSGFAAHAHDLSGLISYVEESLTRLTGTAVHLHLGGPGAGIDLVAGGTHVGSLQLADGPEFDRPRWERLCDAILPQLATAIESAELVDQVRKTHLATIAALSKSMEAKDYYTGGHTERVAEIALALAKELGYAGAELDAIEIGALLHDIGKIGIPETILRKPGPLDVEEWKVMKEHPVISDYILAEVDLPDIVRQIARSSHERIDGAGYPDRLAGEDIPLPARIVLVADAFDALTTDRPYRHGRHTLAALEELRTHAGTQFCPRVVAALDDVFRKQPELLTGFTLRAVEEVA
jgi:putative nucleotidyltransferase with HDIG domain